VQDIVRPCRAEEKDRSEPRENSETILARSAVTWISEFERLSERLSS
jgi:hypothetical protein